MSRGRPWGFWLVTVATVGLIGVANCVSVLARSGPYRGRVIDAETREPIEGAVVLAVWYRAVYGGPGGPVERFEDAAETLTNAQGEFEIPGRALGSLVPWTEFREPRFTIFKPGYGVLAPRGRAHIREAVRSLLDGRPVTVKLPPLKTEGERGRNLESFTTISVPPEKKPLLLRAINEERRALGLGPVGM